MKAIVGLIFGLLVFAQSAQAQTSTFYGPQGQYQGQATTHGNTTTFYGGQGQYQGTANTFGNTTTLYGPQGQYQGTVQQPMQQPRFNQFGR